MIFALTAVIGAILGSVANMLIYRLPRGLPIAMARSQCPTCTTPLNGWDLVPIVSFVTSFGRCRHCNAAIAWRYLLVELLCVGISLGLVSTWGISIALLYWATAAYFGLLIFFIDMETQLIPDRLSLFLFLTGVIGHWGAGSGMSSVISAGVAGGGMWALAAITQKIYRRPTFGGGDTKLMAALGALLGAVGAGWALYTAFIIGSLVTAPLILFKIKKRTDKIAFGPFIILGAVIVSFACLTGHFPFTQARRVPQLIYLPR